MSTITWSLDFLQRVLDSRDVLDAAARRAELMRSRACNLTDPLARVGTAVNPGTPSDPTARVAGVVDIEHDPAYESARSTLADFDALVAMVGPRLVGRRLAAARGGLDVIILRYGSQMMTCAGAGATLGISSATLHRRVNALVTWLDTTFGSIDDATGGDHNAAA